MKRKWKATLLICGQGGCDTARWKSCFTCLPQKTNQTKQKTSAKTKYKTLFSLYFVSVKCDWAANTSWESPPWSQLFPSARTCVHTCTCSRHKVPHVPTPTSKREDLNLCESKSKDLCLFWQPLQILCWSGIGQVQFSYRKAFESAQHLLQHSGSPQTEDLCFANQFLLWILFKAVKKKPCM